MTLPHMAEIWVFKSQQASGYALLAASLPIEHLPRRRFTVQLLKGGGDTLSIWHPLLLKDNSTIRRQRKIGPCNAYQEITDGVDGDRCKERAHEHFMDVYGTITSPKRTIARVRAGMREIAQLAKHDGWKFFVGQQPFALV